MIVEEFNYKKGRIKKDQPPTKKKVIRSVLLLDKSSSMNYRFKYPAAVEGVRAEIDSLLSQSDKVKTYFSIVGFASWNNINHITWNKALSNSDIKLGDAYGNTALNDAICMTLDKLFETYGVDDTVLIKIFTDGEENDSRYFNNKNVKAKIRQAEELGWTVVFFGLKQDVKRAINTYGIDESNTKSYDGTGKGVTETFTASSLANTTYVKRLLSEKDVSRGFFKK